MIVRTIILAATLAITASPASADDVDKVYDLAGIFKLTGALSEFKVAGFWKEVDIYVPSTNPSEVKEIGDAFCLGLKRAAVKHQWEVKAYAIWSDQRPVRVCTTN